MGPIFFCTFLLSLIKLHFFLKFGHFTKNVVGNMYLVTNHWANIFMKLNFKDAMR